jgi:hypothetical protein
LTDLTNLKENNWTRNREGKWHVISHSLISKEPMKSYTKPLSDKGIKKIVAKILKDHPKWRLMKL